MLGEIEEVSSGVFQFKDRRKQLVIEEKWFTMFTSVNTLRKRDTDPEIPCPRIPNVDKIGKIMFLACVGVPQEKADGNYFNGLVSNEPFMKEIPAARKSKNRPKGTLEIKPTSVTAPVFQDMLLKPGGLFDQIDVATEGMDTPEIVVQADGASAHTGKNTLSIINAAGPNRRIPIRMVIQPPQSSDCNKLDLCVFNSLNKKRDTFKRRSKNFKELIANVQL